MLKYFIVLILVNYVRAVMYKIPYTKYLKYKMQDTIEKSISDTRYKYFSKKALTDAQGKEMFLNHILECTKDNPVELSDLEALQQLKTPTKTEVKCLLACGYRALGTLTAKGTFDSEKGYEMAELMKEGDEKRLENGKKLVDMCIKVNDVAVSDGEKGCERAALMFDCAVKNAPKLGFKID